MSSRAKESLLLVLHFLYLRREFSSIKILRYLRNSWYSVLVWYCPLKNSLVWWFSKFNLFPHQWVIIEHDRFGSSMFINIFYLPSFHFKVHSLDIYITRECKFRIGEFIVCTSSSHRSIFEHWFLRAWRSNWSKKTLV